MHGYLHNRALRLSAEPANTVIAKRNRNRYANVLVSQLRNGRIEEPFHLSPPTTAMLPQFTAPYVEPVDAAPSPLRASQASLLAWREAFRAFFQLRVKRYECYSLPVLFPS